MKRGACILFSVLLALGLAGCSAEPAESSRSEPEEASAPQPAPVAEGLGWLPDLEEAAALPKEFAEGYQSFAPGACCRRRERKGRTPFFLPRASISPSP